MIIVFIGSPFSGKGTQVKLLGKEINLPVFAMGDLIKDAYRKGDPKAVEGFTNYSMRGFHLPIPLKFHILQVHMDENPNGFILDNFPANQEDLDAFNSYLRERRLTVDKVFHLFVSEEEVKKRMVARGRVDDRPDILMIRREIQDNERIPVLNHFRNRRILEEINGETSIEELHQEILNRLGKSS